MQVKGIPYSLEIGKEYKYVPNLPLIVKESSMLYDFIMIPLVHSRLYRTERSVKKNPLQIARSDINYKSKVYGEGNMKAKPDCVTIKASIDLESKVDHIRERAEYCLIEEIELAEYLKINSVVFEIPIFQGLGESFFPYNFCRILNGYLLNYPCKVIIRLPLVQSSREEEKSSSHEVTNLSWKYFQKIKRL